MELSGRCVVVGIGGGIAAFKAVEVVRELGRRGAEVRVVMTPSATRFVGPMTLAGITGSPVVTDLWDPRYSGEVHVELGAWADAVIVAPATMNLLARAASGMADDALLATLACARGAIFYAPAMHHRMWGQASTVKNARALEERGAILIGPVEGPLASGELGMGRMAEPVEIVDAMEVALTSSGDLSGRALVISAGPTHEDLDPVRYLGNRSSGKMGYALAMRAAYRGAKVTLVSGPSALPDPSGVETLRVRSALEMKDAIESVANPDVVIMAAAVADYRPAERAPQKIKKGDERQLTLVRNPDILAGLGASREGARPLLVGFALETERVVEYAREKLAKKNADMIVANHASDGFGGDSNLATLVEACETLSLPRMSKLDLADRILDRVVERLRETE